MRSRRITLWQEGYHDHILRSDEDTETVARYIFGNPVRAGLVLGCEDYPFSGGTLFDLMFAATALPLSPRRARG